MADIVVIREPTTVTVTSGTTEVVTATPGPQGPSGAAAGVIEHTQSSPQQTWVVNHNLGFYPSVTVIVSGEEVFPDIIHGSLNQTSIVFAAPTAGIARLRP